MGQLHRIRAASRSAFVVLWHPQAVEDATLRWAAFQIGVNMVTGCPQHLSATLDSIAAQPAGSGAECLQCGWCGLGGLSAAGLWLHHPLYHSAVPNYEGVCDICQRACKNVAVHVHEAHHPDRVAPEERTGVYALVVVQRRVDGKFLVVQECAAQGFWLPGGGVNAGESLQEGAVRECIEEAGVRPVLTGVLTVEVGHKGAWRRVIFFGHPADATQVAKTSPDFESSGACWVHADELPRLPLRSASEMEWFTLVSSGKARIKPLEMPQKWREAFADVRF